MIITHIGRDWDSDEVNKKINEKLEDTHVAEEGEIYNLYIVCRWQQTLIEKLMNELERLQ